MTKASLDQWHQRLDKHFRALRVERDRFAPGRPLFALEHGLDVDGDLADLGQAVRASVSGGRLPTLSWLPFVVYAAEVGYRYQGDEYWPVFEEDTPNWRRRGGAGRLYVRRKYEKFAETYGGAVPSGAWAEWFKNIAWPITHAVLPTDLQRHLARLLYDYRNALSNDLLEDHSALGERLTRRSYDTSARFRKFAENTSLLGLVAASLLLGDEDDTALLLRPTLHRIVKDLSNERQAGAWLRDAKKAAVRARRRGFTGEESAPPGTPRSPGLGDGRSPTLELELSVRRTADGWCAYAAVPSHESLAQRFPDIREELERVRYRMRGVEGVQPRGALMYRRGPLALTRWPPSRESVLSAEGGSDVLSSLLLDSCRLPGGPWLFGLREPGVGSEIRTNSVRPGHEYILLHQGGQSSVRTLGEPLALRTSGVNALHLIVPREVDADVIGQLQEVGVGIVTDVLVWPAGLVPASWDGEGRAAWPAGESPIVGVHSSRSVASCVVATELKIVELPWPEDSDVLFVKLDELSTGSNDVHVALLESRGMPPLAQGRLELRVLEPADSASIAGSRQGLVVRSHPSRPALEELWTGSAAIVADGPRGEKVHFAVALMTRSGRKRLAGTAFSSALPVDEGRWRELFRGARGSADFARGYDDAEELTVSVSSPILGASQVRAERPFSPLRWCVGHDREGPFARLVDHMDSDDLVIDYYDAPHPAERVSPATDLEGRVRTSNGGLVIAKTPQVSVAVVLPPHVSGGLEALGKLRVRPSLQTGKRSAGSVERMIRISRLWTYAAIPADGNAELLQSAVSAAVVARLGGMIGGDRWWEIEYEILYGGEASDQRLLDAVGRGQADRQAAVRLLEVSGRVGSDPASIVAAFGDVLSQRTSEDYRSLAEAILRLASAPGSLPSGDPLVERATDEALNLPVLYRLARLLVLMLARRRQDDPALALQGWLWE